MASITNTNNKRNNNEETAESHKRPKGDIHQTPPKNLAPAVRSRASKLKLFRQMQQQTSKTKTPSTLYGGSSKNGKPLPVRISFLMGATSMQAVRYVAKKSGKVGYFFKVSTRTCVVIWFSPHMCSCYSLTYGKQPSTRTGSPSGLWGF
jgi:hypothetical protein